MDIAKLHVIFLSLSIVLFAFFGVVCLFEFFITKQEIPLFIGGGGILYTMLLLGYLKTFIRVKNQKPRNRSHSITR